MGFEAGTCLRLQMEKDALDNALARLKSADSFSRQFSKDIKGNDYKGVEFDLEGIIMELPQRLVCFLKVFIYQYLFLQVFHNL